MRDSSRSMTTIPLPAAVRSCQESSDAAESADDHVASQVVDLFFHTLEPKKILQLGCGDELHDSAGQIEHAGTAQHDQGDGQRAHTRGDNRMDFFIAHRKQGDDHHVKGIRQIPARYQVPRGTQHHYRQDIDNAVDQRRRGGRLRKLHFGAAAAVTGALLGAAGQSRISRCAPSAAAGSRPSVDTLCSGVVRLMFTQ